MKKYRVVSNGEWFEIEYKYKYWPFWFRRAPHQYSLAGYNMGYSTVDWSEFRFPSVETAVDFIEELIKQEKKERWYVVLYVTEQGYKG